MNKQQDSTPEAHANLCEWPLVFHGTRVRTIIDERDKSLWIHAGDAGELLGYTNIREALTRIKSRHKRGVRFPDTTGRVQEMQFISEIGLNQLAFRSRKDEAEEFTERVAELLAKLRRGELELRPRAQGLLEHESIPQQKQNSIAFNRRAFIEGGREAIIKRNATLCHAISDKQLWPKQYKEWAIAIGLPARDRSSGQQVLRATEPHSGAACSLAKNLIEMGMPEAEAIEAARESKSLYKRILQYGTPAELSTPMDPGEG